MSNEIKTYLKYAHLQIAAEALYELQMSPPGTKIDTDGGPVEKDVLTKGNTRTSVFTETDAHWFASTWTVVEHISNTATGFSGTLFRALVSDPDRGIVAGELVLSFRSTEFADDAVRDNQATNTLEISQKGWAFGQIMDMEMWFSSLKTSGKLDPGAAITVTGYSLGGHPATAFNLLHQGELTAFGAPLISATHTFNGADVGQLRNGKTLRRVMDRACAFKSKAAIHGRSARHA